MAQILLLNGPNLNLLGQREPTLYGTSSLSQIEEHLCSLASKAGDRLVAHQSNAESDLIDWIQQASEQNVDCILLNAAGLTHSSVSLRDAVAAVSVPTIEIHMSNIYARESFRHTSLLAGVVLGSLCGFGSYTYELALKAAQNHLSSNNTLGES